MPAGTRIAHTCHLRHSLQGSLRHHPGPGEHGRTVMEGACAWKVHHMEAHQGHECESKPKRGCTGLGIRVRGYGKGGTHHGHTCHWAEVRKRCTSACHVTTRWHRGGGPAVGMRVAHVCHHLQMLHSAINTLPWRMQACSCKRLWRVPSDFPIVHAWVHVRQPFKQKLRSAKSMKQAHPAGCMQGRIPLPLSPLAAPPNHTNTTHTPGVIHTHTRPCSSLASFSRPGPATPPWTVSEVAHANAGYHCPHLRMHPSPPTLYGFCFALLQQWRPAPAKVLLCAAGWRLFCQQAFNGGKAASPLAFKLMRVGA